LDLLQKGHGLRYRRRVLVADQFPLPDPILQVGCGGGGGGGGAQIGREGLVKQVTVHMQLPACGGCQGGGTARAQTVVPVNVGGSEKKRDKKVATTTTAPAASRSSRNLYRQLAHT
jgi:hypothetical protein